MKLLETLKLAVWSTLLAIVTLFVLAVVIAALYGLLWLAGLFI